MKNKSEQQVEGNNEDNQRNESITAGSSSYERYSDEDLKEFRDLIISKLEEAISDFETLKGTLRLSDDHGTDDTSPTFKLLEDAADVSSKEETAQLASRQEKFIQHLQNALIRVENKSYGVCRVTGKLIPKERLRSVPHATMSIDAKRDNSGR
jgi:DnaK suppressor protein